MTNDYNPISKQWHAARCGFRPGESAFLEAFLKLLPNKARILDLGCGTGIPNARFLTDHAHNVHGIDQSSDLLSIAHEQVPQATFELADLTTYSIPNSFNAALSWDAMFHLPRLEQTRLIERLSSALPTGSPFLFTTGGSTQEPFSDTMWDEEFHYDAHPPEDIPAILKQAGFTLHRSELLEKPSGGRNKGRLAVLALRS